MGTKLGKDAVLYYSATAGQSLSGFTLKLDGVANVDVDTNAGETDVTTRACGGWKATATTLKDCEVSFEMPLDTANAGYIAVRSAYLSGAPIGLAALTGLKTVAGNEGPVGDFTITGFKRGEPIDGAITMSVTAKLYAFKEWAVTVGGTPDTTAPTVITVPAAGATNVVVSADLTATFNEAIDPTCVTADNFRLVKASDGTVVDGALSYAEETFVVTFNPTSSLSAATTYLWILATIKDLAGNTMGTAYKHFTTAS